jgi:hypothetical protein
MPGRTVAAMLAGVVVASLSSTAASADSGSPRPAAPAAPVPTQISQR